MECSEVAVNIGMQRGSYGMYWCIVECKWVWLFTWMCVCIISVFFDRKEDSGNYSCQAYNVEGQVESAPQQLTVMCK